MRAVGILLLAWACAPGLMPQDAPVPCLPLSAEKSCLACHPVDAGARWEGRRSRPCARYCQACHAPKAMESHHPIDRKLPKVPPSPLLLTADGMTGCSTCHDLGQPRFDRTRWRAESLFDRLFRRQARYKTYFLAVRNDRGQLCRTCH